MRLKALWCTVQTAVDKFINFCVYEELDGTSAFSRVFSCEQARNVNGNISAQKLSFGLRQAGCGKLETDSLLYVGLLIATSAKYGRERVNNNDNNNCSIFMYI